MLGALDAFSILEEARRILSKAFEELREGVKSGDMLKIRDACEKGWLATVKAVDALLLSYGFEETKTHVDRRRKLRDLSKKVHKVVELGCILFHGSRNAFIFICCLNLSL
jgi:hypothetical protein